MSYEIEVVYTFNEIIPIIHSSTLTKRPIEKHNATTLFTRGQPISSAPGRTNGKNIRLHGHLPRIDDKERSGNKFPLIP